MFITFVCMFTVENTIINLHVLNIRQGIVVQKKYNPLAPLLKLMSPSNVHDCLSSVCMYEVSPVKPAKFQFGFITNTPLKAFRGGAFVHTNEDFLALHNRLRQDKRPNCM